MPTLLQIQQFTRAFIEADATKKNGHMRRVARRQARWYCLNKQRLVPDTSSLKPAILHVQQFTRADIEADVIKKNRHMRGGGRASTGDLLLLKRTASRP